MNFLTQIILPYLLLYKYWAIFGITLVAALAFPIPPGTLLMAAAAFAAQGYLSFAGIIAAGSLGNIAGDNIGYWIARVYGKRVLNKIGFKKTLESQKYKNIEARILKKPKLLIFFSRFEVFSNLAVNLICGLSGLSYKKYFLYESIGEIAQVSIYCGIGYVVGDNWQVVSGLITNFLIFIILIAALFVVIFWKKIWAWITRDTSATT